MIYSRQLDYVIAVKILKLLSTRWEDIPIIKQGIMDKNGKILIPRSKRTKAQNLISSKLEILILRLRAKIERYVPSGKAYFRYLSTALHLVNEEIIEDKQLLEFQNELLEICNQFSYSTNGIQTVLKEEIGGDGDSSDSDSGCINRHTNADELLGDKLYDSWKWGNKPKKKKKKPKTLDTTTVIKRKKSV